MKPGRIDESEPTPQQQLIAYSPKPLAALILVGPGETLSERAVRDWCEHRVVSARKIGGRAS